MADADDDPFHEAKSHHTLEDIRCRTCGRTETLWVQHKPKLQELACRGCGGHADIVRPEKPNGAV